MYIEISTYDSNKDTRPHSHRVCSGHIDIKMDSQQNCIEIEVSEQEERINGKRLIDYNLDMVKIKNYKREAFIKFTYEDLNKILQIALDQGLISVQIAKIHPTS